MDVREVRRLARLRRVFKSPRYHPGKRGISFVQVLTALERCYHVEKDDRPGTAGRLAHPDGWFALANVPGRRRLRVDFDVLRDRDGNSLLIVTAYHV